MTRQTTTGAPLSVQGANTSVSKSSNTGSYIHPERPLQIPARRLRLTDPRFGRQAGDWIKLRTGYIVIDRDDPRHQGRVEAIRNGAVVVVKWDNGWTSKVPIEKLERVR